MTRAGNLPASRGGLQTAITVNFPSCLSNVVGRDLVFTLSISAQQRTITDQVDQAGNSQALAIEFPDGGRAEDIPAQPGDTQTVAKVSRQICLLNGIQMIPGGHTLIELAQFGQCQHVL